MNDPEELRAVCDYWQRRLRLQDWLVDIRQERMRDFEVENRLAEIETDSDQRRALIFLLDPLDWPTDVLGGLDVEATLVHELLHLYTEPLNLPRPNDANKAEEVLINALAGALVRLRRELGDDWK